MVLAILIVLGVHAHPANACSQGFQVAQARRLRRADCVQESDPSLPNNPLLDPNLSLNQL